MPQTNSATGPNDLLTPHEVEQILSDTLRGLMDGSIPDRLAARRAHVVTAWARWREANLFTR